MRVIFFALALLPSAAWAQYQASTIEAVIEHHVLPGFADLVVATDGLAATAAADCTPMSADLRAAYGVAVDAWLSVSHLRFGPTETENRGFALAFWPDTRAVTPRVLARLIATEDPIGVNPAAYADVSIAGRGFYALEFLLYDADIFSSGAENYRCTLVQTVTADIAQTSQDIAADWQDRYAALMLEAGTNETYQSTDEALRQLLGALSSGLEFTTGTRLGRPLGSFDRPRPNRAEMRRSGRALHNVTHSLQALGQLAHLLAGGNADLAMQLDSAFARAHTHATRLDDPVFAGVATSQGRIRVEVLQQRISEIRQIVSEQLAPALGVTAGFNSMDGD